MTRVDIDVDDAQTLELWNALADVVKQLPGEWVLVGGLMVQLHALEGGATEVRVTADIDVLGQARPQGALDAIDDALRATGFELVGPDIDGFAHRYQRETLTIDVLCPEGIRPPPTIGGLKAVGIPGGTQALSRAELVTVSVDGREFELRRPTLLGAILIKARSLMKARRPRGPARGSSAAAGAGRGSAYDGGRVASHRAAMVAQRRATLGLRCLHHA